MPARQSLDLARHGDVASPQLPVALDSHRLHHRPDLERPELSGELGAQIGNPNRAFEIRILLEREVFGAVREHGAQRRRVTHQRRACLVRDVEPFVGIEGDRIGPLDAAIQRRELGERGTDRAVGAVHVEPATVFPRHLGEPGEWVPALATTQTGPSPALRSAAIISRNAVTSIRYSRSTGTRRSASVPRPSSSTARRTQEWASVDA